MSLNPAESAEEMNFQSSGLSQEKSNLLHKIYYDPSNPASFSSIKKLYNAARLLGDFSLQEIKNWLKSQSAYTLHKQRRVNFIRNSVIAENVDEQYQADIVDMQQFSKSNKGYKYILTVIDILSKYAFALPLKSKGSHDVKNAFKEIFKYRKPLKIQTDKGKEFLNKEVQNLFNNKKSNISHQITTK